MSAYQEELKMPSESKKRFYYQTLIINDSFDISAYSNVQRSRCEDYYTLQGWMRSHVWSIGDVSGKGPQQHSYGQYEREFQSLIQIKLSPSDFLIKAKTSALSQMSRTESLHHGFNFLDNTERNDLLSMLERACPDRTLQLHQLSKSRWKNWWSCLGILRRNKAIWEPQLKKGLSLPGLEIR